MKKKNKFLGMACSVGIPAVTAGTAEDRAFYSAFPFTKSTQIHKFKNSKRVQRDPKLQTNILLTKLFCDFSPFLRNFPETLNKKVLRKFDRKMFGHQPRLPQ